MRPLTEDETKIFFEKLTKFIGQDAMRLIDRKDEPHVFRLHKNRVYYVSESQLKLSTNFSKEKLMALGTMFGKFTKSGKFRLTIHCLDYLAKYTKHKVWIKANSEMSFLYGHHVTQAGVGRITENVPQYGGVIVYNMSGVPLGFGLAGHTTLILKTVEPTAIAVIHQGDVGEYLRDEQEMN